jgi:hypothetical protein
VPPAPPADVQHLAAAHRRRQQQIAAQAVAETNRLWGFLQTLGWPGVATRMVGTVQSALAEAARGAQDYVAAAVRGWGKEPDPAGQVAERTFAATASDGRPLDTLLERPSLEVTAFVGQGMPHDQADAIGKRHLQRIVATQVADAARVSTGAAVVNDREVEGYIRLLTLPSCNRCIILAGQFYRWNDGFERHPSCDCVHQIATEVTDPPSPREVYDSLTDDERRTAGWSGFDQRAIDDGADLFQVTNYKRALKTVSIAGRPVRTTTHGAGRRSLAGKRLGATRRNPQVTRLTPEAIYLDADRLGWDRDETIRVLMRHGYIL